MPQELFAAQFVTLKPFREHENPPTQWHIRGIDKYARARGGEAATAGLLLLGQQVATKERHRLLLSVDNLKTLCSNSLPLTRQLSQLRLLDGRMRFTPIRGLFADEGKAGGGPAVGAVAARHLGQRIISQLRVKRIEDEESLRDQLRCVPLPAAALHNVELFEAENVHLHGGPHNPAVAWDISFIDIGQRTICCHLRSAVCIVCSEPSSHRERCWVRSNGVVGVVTGSAGGGGGRAGGVGARGASDPPF